MKWSKSYLFTLKEAPADAEIASHQLMVRAGMIRKIAPGVYTYGYLALRAIRKFEQIVREELDKRDCQEILMPMVHPKSLWEESGRWHKYGEELQRFKGRGGHEFCLGPTHEEVITDYVRRDLKSYRDLPFNLYQIQTKYRNEIRPRFGLMRGREFIMKDAYSFDADEKGALESYERMYEAYSAIFSRVGFEFRVVEADAGNIGGSKTHEFQVLAKSGEDELLVCDKTDFAANIEVAPAAKIESSKKNDSPEPMQEFDTPGLRSIAELSKATGVADSELVKTMFFSAATTEEAAKEELKPVAVLLRGCDEVNLTKLKNLLGTAGDPLMLTDEEVRQVTGAWPGSCGPVGLKIPIYADESVVSIINMIAGANKDDKHLKNVNIDRDFKVTKSADLRTARPGETCPKSGGVYKSIRGIETGHIFYLGNQYSKSMDCNYLNAEGKQVAAEMGCYGIGITRTVQAAVEQCHDDDGIVWPLGIAPFTVHMCVLDPDDENVAGPAQKAYDELWKKGIDVLMDNRSERPGVKFKDADLLGMPLRLTFGRRGLQNGEIELVDRKTKNMEKIAVGEVVSTLISRIQGQ